MENNHPSSFFLPLKTQARSNRRPEWIKNQKDPSYTGLTLRWKLLYRNVRNMRSKIRVQHITRKRHIVDCECTQAEQSLSWPVIKMAIMAGHVAIGRKRHSKYKILMEFQGALYTLGKAMSWESIERGSIFHILIYTRHQDWCVV